MKHFEVTSAKLHIIAMVTMLIDHLYHVFDGDVWMNCLGRLSFPIFCFMLVEGYFHTSNFDRYLVRLFITAVAAEIPFDMAFFGVPVYWEHQNVMWTFLMAICLIHLWEASRRTNEFSNFVCVGVITGVVCYAAEMWLKVDYGGIGVLTVLLFYVFRKRVWWNYALQLVGMILLHVVMGSSRQSFAVLALLPIWLYQGKQGFHTKWFQYVCYGFYPLHLLILGLITVN